MKIILASKKWGKKKILDNNNISAEVIVSNVDEDQAKLILCWQTVPLH